ncbi:helix-turn-helix domain-containing protein [Sedimenticola hydrogenitrophicus]|uniref:helix-turn-helix domain-containing protein n=1 Tax=Sedimenticola hydrogenitrophicus TaxID=2967975 RepID=UPI0021A2C5D0|nr:helix-turn-helix domain-containing protein [Sedimenticola hydrogenitrophicus]
MHYKTITEFTRAMGLPEPEHPLLYVYVTDRLVSGDASCCQGGVLSYSTDFYAIAIKDIISGELRYGRTKYDFTNGSMMFTAPRQELTFSEVVVSSDVMLLFIHEDFIRGHKIRSDFKKYGFFSYAVNEALHLSAKEVAQMRALLNNIHAEYRSNQDEFSKDLLLSQVDTLLKYANRYYKRQFLDRTDLSREIASRFEDALQSYFEEGKLQLLGTPRIEEIAQKMGMSARYLSDMLKAETGKSALEHIHLYLLDEAKDLLLQPHVTVAEVAYRLGFDYPQYFSRLFKKKIGVSPKAYRDENSVH